jgi:hypothetical protein
MYTAPPRAWQILPLPHLLIGVSQDPVIIDYHVLQLLYRPPPTINRGFTPIILWRQSLKQQQGNAL